MILPVAVPLVPSTLVYVRGKASLEANELLVLEMYVPPLVGVITPLNVIGSYVRLKLNTRLLSQTRTFTVSSTLYGCGYLIETL